MFTLLFGRQLQTKLLIVLAQHSSLFAQRELILGFRRRGFTLTEDYVLDYTSLDRYTI